MAGLTATTATWVTVPIRLALGSIAFAHGAQKVFGFWGGNGLQAWTSGIAPLNLRPSWMWLGAAAMAELIGGVLVFFGLFTRVGAFFIACTMSVAIAGVHWNKGLFLSQGGYEFAMALLAMALSLIIAGGGSFSIDSQMSG
ncbi:MAG: DoxX family protein [Acidobacteria bacterium]|nr:DoxX family protein [Acidobacteriota bacterium]